MHLQFIAASGSLLGCIVSQSLRADVTAEAQEPVRIERSGGCSQLAVDKTDCTSFLPLVIGRLAGEPLLTPPPVAPVPPPRLVIPERNTLTFQTYQNGDHTITIQDVLPVALPPRPDPKPLTSTAEKQSLPASSGLRQKLQFITLSSTVYDHKATHITWRSDDGTQVFEAWSNVDFNILRGITHVLQGNTRKIYVHLGIGEVDTEKMAARCARFKWPYKKPQIPVLPDTPETDPSFVVTRGYPGPEDLAKIQVLHDLFRAEHPRLKAAADFIRTQNESRAAKLIANPPKSPDIIVKRWSLSGQKSIADLENPTSQVNLSEKNPQSSKTKGGAQ